MAIEKKVIHLNENLEVIDGNRDYYVYFERIGHRFSKIEDLVYPNEKEEVLNFIRETDDKTQHKVFRFFKQSEGFKYNIIQVFEENYKNQKVKTIELTDIDEMLNYISISDFEIKKLNDILSLTNELFFSYSKKDNVFKMISYHSGNCRVIFNQDLDSFEVYVIERKLIPFDESENFKKFIDELKTCPEKFFKTLKCGFRFAGKIMESLDFIGVKHEFNDSVMVNGRVLENSRLEQKLNLNSVLEEMQYDSLTKTLNKKAIIELSKRKIANAEKDEKIALIIVDLDNFKPINDAYGHLAGDKVLEETGKILRNIMESKGFVGRYGGDEFLVILNNANSESILRGILQAILESIRNHFANAFDDIKITTSIGASMFPKNGNSYDELFKKADFCLYRAKDKGRNRYVFFREDLHLELFKKSIETTTGVKYQGREIQELKYMANFMQSLGVTPYKAIKEVLEHMKDTYNLDDITIYYGENLERIYYVGTNFDCQKDAKYVFWDEFRNLLKKNKNFIRMDFPEDLKNSEKISKLLSERKISSTIQCILGSPEEIKGLVTFDRLEKSAQWAEYEVNCAVMFSSSFNLLPESTKVDFALFSKLKTQSE